MIEAAGTDSVVEDVNVKVTAPVAVTIQIRNVRFFFSRIAICQYARKNSYGEKSGVKITKICIL